MEDSDDYGDLDDSAFLEAATQVEKSAFQPSPRSSKRRKLGATPSIPPRIGKQHRAGPFLESDDEDDVASVSTAASRPRTDRSHHASASPTKRTNRATSKGKENGSPEDDGLSKNARKKRDRIYQPKVDVDMTDVFYTQPPREDSPPWKPRGAIWRKSGPALSIGVHRPSEPSQPERWTGLDAMKTMGLPGRQSIASRPVPRAPESPEHPFSSVEIVNSPRLPAAGAARDDYDPTQELADLPSDAFASSSPEKSPQKQTDDVVIMSERRTRLVAPQTGLRQTTLHGPKTSNVQLPSSQANKRYNYVADVQAEQPTHHKMDMEAAKTWVYPTNIGVVRDYQFNIVAKGLYHNLLVALPTGLGKTFIAATVMLNWYRWTTHAQIVFVAPTKPLVAQQVEACFNVAGIPRSQTTMLTGGVSTGLRAEEWKSKRVFFMTPQTLLNDLKSGIADPKNIVLLVFDEAHKATGSYAYVEVVSLIRRFNPSYRILALTATPGADVEAVQKVIDGLDISRIEIRTENSLDIRGYVHQRSVEKQTFSNSDEMEMCMELYSQAVHPLVKKLHGMGVFWSPNPIDLTPFGCTQSQRKWMQETGRNASQGEKSMVMAIVTILASLSQGMELLKYHGIGPFYTKMKEFKDAQAGSKSKYRKEICENKAFKELLTRLHAWVTNDNFVGHPKLDYLQQVVLDHFLDAGEGRHADGAPPSQTRIMIFAHFRDSAEEIVRILKRHEPMIRPRVFVGQASGKNSDGMTQKDQLEVIEKFKMGTFNTLVATSIGEEGLDIGEVDLIVCYDAKASPIRMLQRMGRTGRKRQGRIVLLQMKGKEESDSMKAKDSYEKMQEIIAEGSRFAFHDDVSRRILPREVQPVVDKRAIEIPPENSQSDFLPEPRKNGRAPKRPPKKFHMPDGVITGFVTAKRMDQEIAPPKSRAKKKAAPTYPSEEPYAIPPLETVLLDNKATKDLERRYQTVFDDDEAPMIADLRLDRDIARQRRPTRPSFFRKPGRVTQTFVQTLQRMHAMDARTHAELQRHVPDFEYESEVDIVVSDGSGAGGEPLLEEDGWASDDPASQPIPVSKSIKAAPKRKAASVHKPVTVTIAEVVLEEDMWASDDPASQPVPVPKSKAAKTAKTSMKPKAAPTRKSLDKTPIVEPTLDEDMWASDDPASQPAPAPTVKAVTKRKATTTRKSVETTGAMAPPPPPPKTATPRGRPRKAVSTPNYLAHRPKSVTPVKTPRYGASGMAEEGASSSPPPTDPRFCLPTQGVDLGSDDTIGEDIDDTQAYLLDSDLRSFIAQDDEEVDAPDDSSLPDLDTGGFGRGTQAVVKSGRPKRAKKAEKLFTSDVTDDDAVVSSDTDDDVPIRMGARNGTSKKTAYAVDSDSEAEEEDEPIIPTRKRTRRVVEDDDDDD